MVAVVHEDTEPDATFCRRIEELENDNQNLRLKLNQMERELHGRSPTKKKTTRSVTHPLKELGGEDTDIENTISGFTGMVLHEGSSSTFKFKTPAKKQRYGLLRAFIVKRAVTDGDRKLTTRKWDLGLEASSP